MTVAAETGSQAWNRRPTAVTVLAAIDFILAAVHIPVGTILITTAHRQAKDSSYHPFEFTGTIYVLGIVLAGIGLIMLAAGIGLLTLKQFGRICQLMVSWPGLFVIPAGTFLSIVMLRYMRTQGSRILFAEYPPESPGIAEQAEINRLHRKGAARPAWIALVVLVVSIAVIAAMTTME